MNRKLIELSEKRERLVNRAAQQRLALGRDIEPWRAPLPLADRGIIVVRYVRHHPQWVVGIVVLLAVVRPARAWKWLERGLISWQVVKTLGADNSGIP